MVFYLSKLAFWIFMPLTWLLGILFYAIITKQDKRRKNALITLLFLIILLTNPWLSNKIMNSWEGSVMDIRKLEKYELAVVLSGVTQDLKNEDGRVFFSKGADRVTHTVDLWKRKKIEKILVSGGNGKLNPTKYDQKECELMASALMMMGVDKNDIILENQSRNTFENAQFSKSIIDSVTNKKILLVTSAFHQTRASLCFKKAGIQFDSLPVDYYSSKSDFGLTQLIPNTHSLVVWEVIMHEILGIVSYKILGRI